MTTLPPSRCIYRTIVKELSPHESDESGCPSDVEEVDYNSIEDSQAIQNIEASTEMVVSDFENKHLTIPTFKTLQRSASVSSDMDEELSSTNRKRLLSCPHPYDNTDDNTVSTQIRTKNLLNPRPLCQQITGDSGRGASITNLLNHTSQTDLFYDSVHIHGFHKKAYMPNRFEFDLGKVMAYQLRQTQISKNKSKIRVDQLDSNSWNKSAVIFSSLFSIKKSPTISTIPHTPLVRHHSSRCNIDKNQ